MLGIVANHPNHAFTLDDFAFGTDFLNGRFNLHVFLVGSGVRFKVGGQAVLGRQNILPTPWLTERHGYDPT